MTSTVAEKRVREIALQTERVYFSQHALERMEEREIFDVDVFRVLRGGFVSGEVELQEEGDWKCKMTLKIRGTREVGVVVVIFKADELFIVTVEWEDVR